MILKRVRAGENRAEIQSVKWTAEGIVKRHSPVFCDVKGYVSFRGYDGIRASARSPA